MTKKRHTPEDVDELFADLSNLDLPRDDTVFEKKLKCEINHGRRIGWFYKEDDDYFRKYEGDNPRESPPYSGLMVCTPGKEMRGGADTDLDHDQCIVIVERFPTEKCYPDSAWIALGRLLDADDLVEVFSIEDES